MISLPWITALLYFSSPIDTNALTFETDNPRDEIPQAIIVRGEGVIVDPDDWTPMPTSPPVITIAPTAHPTETTMAPTPHSMMLMTRGKLQRCPGDIDVPWEECLDAASEVIQSDEEAKSYKFPYHLNIITSNEMPCGCFFEHDDAKVGDFVFVSFNNIGSNNCASHDDAQLICGACGSEGAEKQSDYRGTISVTENGNPCLVWKDNPFSAYDPYGADTGEGLRGNSNNYCRNPHGDYDRAWCYIDGDTKEYCNVPYCANLASQATTAPTPAQCTTCTNNRNTWMANTNQQCTTKHNLAQRCRHKRAWVDNKTCQLSCFMAGHGYDGDNCCIP